MPRQLERWLGFFFEGGSSGAVGLWGVKGGLTRAPHSGRVFKTLKRVGAQ